MISFALLAVLTTLICGTRVFWVAAVVAHVGSTLSVYIGIELWRLFEPSSMLSAWNASDYGLSAASAGWIGAVAASGWRASGDTLPAKATISLSCVAIGLVAYLLHPGVTILSSEHVLAFAAGALVAKSMPSGRLDRVRALRSFARPVGRGVSHRAVQRDPVAVAAVGITILILSGAGMPTALGALSRSLREERPQHSSCLNSESPIPRTCSVWRNTGLR